MCDDVIYDSVLFCFCLLVSTTTHTSFSAVFHLPTLTFLSLFLPSNPLHLPPFHLSSFLPYLSSFSSHIPPPPLHPPSQVPSDKACVSFIYGPKGSAIIDMERMSRCRIVFDKEPLPVRILKIVVVKLGYIVVRRNALLELDTDDI